MLYFIYLSPQQLRNVEEIIEKLRPHIHDICFRTYYRQRRAAIDALSPMLRVYASKDTLNILENLFIDGIKQWQVPLKAGTLRGTYLSIDRIAFNIGFIIGLKICS